MQFITLIPTRYNDGSRVEQHVLDEIVSDLTIRFGGTSYLGLVRGTWVNPAGERFNDTCRRIAVAIPSDRMDEARKLVIEIGRRLGQESMYFEVRHDDVEFLNVE